MRRARPSQTRITPKTMPSQSKRPLFSATAALLLIFAAGFVGLYAVMQDQDSVEKTSQKTLSPRQKTFNAQSYTLANGLQVVVIPNHRAPVVTHMVWYKVGAADEPHGQSGIAHFLEHLMFKGSRDMPPGEFSKTIRSLGGRDNAFTSQDYTAYYQSVAVDHLPTVMQMEAGRMRDLQPPAAHVLSERNVILEERRQRIDNSPTARFNEHLRAATFINHPYGTPIIGWFHEMEALTWEMAKNFYDQHYGPDNAILIVTGDVTGEHVLNLAQQYYGDLKPITPAPRIRTQVPPLYGQTTLSEITSDIQQGQISLLYRAPSYAQDKQASLALDLLQEVMAGSASSRLYQALVVEQKLATAINLSYNGTALNDGLLSISAYPAQDVAPDIVKAAIEEQLTNLATHGITNEELATAKQKAQDTAVFARDSLTGPALIIGQALTTGATLNSVEYWAHDIAQISKEAVNKVAATYLNPTADSTHMTYGAIMPPSTHDNNAPGADKNGAQK